MTENYHCKRFKPSEIARSFPATAETLLIDTYLTNEPAASSRVWRVYRELPPHYHADCDEYLYVLSGRGIFWMDDASNEQSSLLGTYSFFKRRSVHALRKILEGPVVFLSFDSPRRVILVNPTEGTPESFVRRKEQ